MHILIINDILNMIRVISFAVWKEQQSTHHIVTW